jgi:chromosome segregation ATPase
MNLKPVITPHYLSLMSMYTYGSQDLREALVGASELIEKQAAEIESFREALALEKEYHTLDIDLLRQANAKISEQAAEITNLHVGLKGVSDYNGRIEYQLAEQAAEIARLREAITKHKKDISDVDYHAWYMSELVDIDDVDMEHYEDCERAWDAARAVVKEQAAEIANLKTLAQAVMTEYACGDGVDNLHPELRAAFRALAKALEVDR